MLRAIPVNHTRAVAQAAVASLQLTFRAMEASAQGTPAFQVTQAAALELWATPAQAARPHPLAVEGVAAETLREPSWEVQGVTVRSRAEVVAGTVLHGTTGVYFKQGTAVRVRMVW